MCTTQEVLDLFVEPMRGNFKDEPGIDPASFYRALAEHMSDLSIHQLARGSDRLIRTRKYRTFPNVAECREACEAYSREPPKAAKTPIDAATEAREAWERKRRAWDLCRCELGREADRDFWLTGLLEFCTEHGRLPDQYEIGPVKAGSMRANLVAFCDSAPPMLAKLREAMHARARREVFERAAA